MLLMISRKLKPLLSKGILIAFSKSTGGKRKKGESGRGRGRVRGRESCLSTSSGDQLPGKVTEWLHCCPLLVGRNSMPINVKGYACFNIGFVSAVPVNTRGICSALNGRRGAGAVKEKRRASG